MFDKSKRGIEDSNSKVQHIESSPKIQREQSLIELVKITSIMRQLKINQCEKAKLFKSQLKEKDRQANSIKTRCSSLKTQIEKTSKESGKNHISKNKEKISNDHEEYQSKKQTKAKRDDKKISDAEQKVDILVKQINELKLLLQAEEKRMVDLSDELKACKSIGSSLKKFEKVYLPNQTKALKKYKIKEEYEVLIAVELSMLGNNFKPKKDQNMREEPYHQQQIHEQSEEDEEEDETSFLAEYESQSERDNEGQHSEDFVFVDKMGGIKQSEMMVEIQPKWTERIEKEELNDGKVNDNKSTEDLCQPYEKQQSLQKDNQINQQSQNSLVQQSSIQNGVQSWHQNGWFPQIKEWFFELIYQI